jgi:PAS domain S-box-containing protein
MTVIDNPIGLEESSEALPVRSPTNPLNAEDWAALPIGEVEQWSASLQNAASLVLSNPLPMLLLWGAEWFQVYNLAYQDLLPSGMETGGLGRSLREYHPEVWNLLHDSVQTVLQSGAPLQLKNQSLWTGSPSDRLYTISCSVVWENNTIGGVLITLCESQPCDSQPWDSQPSAAQTPTAQTSTTQTPDLSESIPNFSHSLRSLLDSVPVLISYVDADQRYRFTNKAYENWFGISPAELNGKHIREVIGETAYESVYPYITAVLSGQEVNYDRKIPYANETRHINATLIPQFDEHNTVIGWTALLRDVTDYKQLEAKLRRSHAQLRRLIDSDMVGVIFADFRGNISQANDAFLKQVGYTRDQWEQERPNWLSFTPPEWVNRDVESIENILRTGASPPFEKEYFRRDGSRIPVLVSAVLLPDVANECICLIIDQTERKAVEAALRDSETRFRQLADAMPQVVWTARPDGYLDYYNQRWYDFTGFSKGKGGDQSWVPVLHPDDVQRCIDGWYGAVRSGHPYSIEYRFWDRKTDTYRWHLGRALPIRDETGAIVRWFGSCTDIDQQKRAQLEVQQLNETLEQRVHERTAQLETINKELESFSYSVSHDLRAPLRHIDGFVNLLQKRLAPIDLDDTSQRYLHTIAQTTKQAGVLIDDLLAFSRMGRSEMRQMVIDMNQLVAEVHREIQLDIKDRIVHWQIEPLPNTVQGDLSMLRQVLRNLISNAVKYTRSRAIATIQIGHLPDNQQDVFFIRDNGIGFNMQYSHKLFGIFQRLHSDPQFEGTGIGLANVQRIIHRHGGRTWAEGVLDQGATFYFSLPKNYSAEPFNSLENADY